MTAWLDLVICIAAIGLAGARLSRYGDVFAERTRFGRSRIGLALLALCLLNGHIVFRHGG